MSESVNKLRSTALEALKSIAFSIMLIYMTLLLFNRKVCLKYNFPDVKSIHPFALFTGYIYPSGQGKFFMTDVDTTALDNVDFTVVHPLTFKWTFWYLKPPSGNVENWSDLLQKLVTVDSVEQFWGAYNSIPKVTELPVKADIAFFKEGISPEWEDSLNAHGGKWIAQISLADEIDNKWLNLLLSLVGGTIDEEESVINGVFVMVRPRGIARVQMWVNSDAQKSLEAAKKLKNVLNLNERNRIEYQAHNEPRQKSGGLQLRIEL